MDDETGRDETGRDETGRRRGGGHRLSGLRIRRFVGRAALIWTTNRSVFYAGDRNSVQVEPSERETVMTYSLRILALMAMMVASGIPGLATASAATFTVNVQTFVDESDQPVADHRVVMDNGLFYDLPQIETSIVTVYDTAAGTVTMLDRAKQVQTTVAIDDLVRITAQARAAADTPDKRHRLGIDAVVAPSTRVSGFTIHFGGATYHTTTQAPADPEMASDFARFSDLASRLNLVQRHWLPPFARMTLGDHLRTIGQMPLETTLAIERGGQVHQYRSRVMIGDIDANDTAAIKQTAGMRALFREVTLDEFPAQ